MQDQASTINRQPVFRIPETTLEKSSSLFQNALFEVSKHSMGVMRERVWRRRWGEGCHDDFPTLSATQGQGCVLLDVRCCLSPFFRPPLPTTLPQRPSYFSG